MGILVSKERVEFWLEIFKNSVLWNTTIADSHTIAHEILNCEFKGLESNVDDVGSIVNIIEAWKSKQ